MTDAIYTLAVEYEDGTVMRWLVFPDTSGDEIDWDALYADLNPSEWGEVTTFWGEQA